jgi:hypothetical protein
VRNLESSVKYLFFLECSFCNRSENYDFFNQL